MAQILNILQDGISNRPEGGQIQVFGLPGTVPVPSSGTLDEKFTVIALDDAGDPQGFTLAVTIEPAGVLTATPAAPTTNPATITLAAVSGADLSASPEITVKITATPSPGPGDPAVETRTVTVVAGA
jgi:hypothetical protein